MREPSELVLERAKCCATRHKSRLGPHRDVFRDRPHPSARDASCSAEQALDLAVCYACPPVARPRSWLKFAWNEDLLPGEANGTCSSRVGLAFATRGSALLGT